MNEFRYRERIYGGYVSARPESLAPMTLAGLKPREAYLNRLIDDHFPADRQSAILELGCGHGALVHFAQQKGYTRMEGVDGSAQQVDAALRLGIRQVRCADVMDTLRATPDASRDAIVAFDLIEHFTRDELIALVDEARRVLRPGGRWIIHVPNGESPFGSRILYGDLTHELAFTRTSISQLLLSSGFSRIDCFEDQPIAHSAASLARLVLWKGFRAVLRLYLVAETGSVDRHHLFSQNLLAVAIR